MQFIPIPKVAQVSIRGTIEQSQIQNSLYFLYQPGAITLDLLELLAIAIEDWWTLQAKPVLQIEYSYREVYAVDLTSQTGPAATSSASAGWVGTRAAGGACPPNVTIAVSFRTGQRGRSYRGRNFWPTIGKSDVVGSQLSQPVIDLIESVYDDILPFGGALPAGWLWVVASRFSNKQPRVQGVALEVQDVLIVDRTVDSQRRRLPGRGV